MTNASTFSNFGDLNEAVIDGLADEGFIPIHDNDEDFVVETYGPDLGRRINATVEYYARRKFDAVYIGPDAMGVGAALRFAAWSEDGCNLVATNQNGVIDAEARFTWSPTGVAMFTKAAAV